MPVNLSFVEDQSILFEILEKLVDMLFIVDIFVNFLTAYKQENELVTDCKLIAKNYIYGWFLFDLIASIPL